MKLLEIVSCDKFGGKKKYYRVALWVYWNYIILACIAGGIVGERFGGGAAVPVE